MLSLVWAECDPLPAGDRGLSYGDGLFETIRVHGQRLLLGDRHLTRLHEGAQRLGIPVARSDLESCLAEALDRYARPGDWVLKLILTRGVGGRGYVPPVPCQPRLILSCHEMPVLPDPAGVSVQLGRHPLAVNPVLAGLKSLNRLDQVMASAELGAGNYEVLMTDGHGHLLEGTRTNLMLRVSGQWLMPPMSALAVHGVMQAEVKAQLQAAGEVVREQPLDLSLLSHPQLDGVFLMNSVTGIVPVSRIDDRDLPIDGSLATICRPLTSLK
ncbi:aminodeoxychorismate lyase [Marinobacter mobilis]|uniref:Aminodeoxychorismate lyase n=1 Tax=Marinobacter mobilis TaxID=488533 RepID=A0A1H2Z426_9GAMM|nr:aminodeoxychorismate lyase [Marinobacter mobilis]SDX12075.1 4-amino-4-deoxychorismate lyase [Marinobacter mobilis]